MEQREELLLLPTSGCSISRNEPHLGQRETLSKVRNMCQSLEGQRNKPGPPEHKLSITLPKKGDFTFSPKFVFNNSGGSTISSNGGSDHAWADVSPDKEEQDVDEEEEEKGEGEEQDEEE